MRLRRQLIAVSLLTLALPWAGCQFIREMEGAMREGQIVALAATAQAVADRIGSDTALLALLQNPALTANPAPQLYVHSLQRTMVLDGYDDDWRDLPIAAESMRYSLSADAPLQAHYQIGADNDALWFFVSVIDSDIHYHNPAQNELVSGDYLLLRAAKNAGEARDYFIRSSAPGTLNAYYRDSQQRVQSEPRIHGFWQETTTGFALELRAPFDLVGDALALFVIDSGADDLAKSTSTTWVGTMPDWRSSALPALIRQSATLQSAVEIFARNGLQLRIASANQWLIADTGTLTRTSPAKQSQPSAFTWIYRLALGDPVLPALDSPQNRGRFEAAEVSAALAGDDASQWYNWSSMRVGRAVVPVIAHNENGAGKNNAGDANASNSDANEIEVNTVELNTVELNKSKVVAAVAIQQSTNTMLALTNSAFSRLLYYSLLTMLLAGIGLISYASWLSWRIRRLSRAADSAIDSNGYITGHFPDSKAADEIGDLTRSYRQLLGRLREYTDYLRSLSGKLSHELRTPLAVVRSSIDNLEHESLSASARTYAQRAHNGVERLSAILTAMSEASRVEASIEQAEKDSVQLDELLRSVVAAYRDTFTSVIIDFECSLEGEASINGAGELIVQLLDKLIENALDFTPPGGRITFSLQQQKKSLLLTVSNDGPTLPQAMQNQLFDSLVSLRERDDKVHMGLGLYIVRLIADFHGANVSAVNRSDNSGVKFSVEFPVSA